MKTKTIKFVTELTITMLIACLMLIITSPLTYATNTLENKNRIFIATDLAGTPTTQSPAGSSTTTPTTGLSGGTNETNKPPVTPQPAQGTEFSSENPLIPLSETAEGYSELPKLTTGGGIVSMLNQAVGGIFQNLKYILGAMAVLYIMLAAVKMIIAGDNEEVVGNQKKALTYGIIGLAVVGFASELSKVFTVACPAGQPDCMKGGFLSQPSAMIQSAGIFTLEVRIFITFIKYLIGGIAVLMLIRNGVRLIALQGKEESVTLDKKNIAFTSLALILIVFASTMIDKVLYIVDTTRYPVGGVQPAINPQRGIQEIVGATNLIVSFVAPVAIIVLIIGAVMYATSGGKEETTTKAKRMIAMSLIGIVMIFGAFAIVSTIISGQFNP